MWQGRVLTEVIGFQTEMYKTAPWLEYLPLPARVQENSLWREGAKKVKLESDSRSRQVQLLANSCSTCS
jgi:hypothetical protein